jgi:SAM-dependent methyltransferase
VDSWKKLEKCRTCFDSNFSEFLNFGELYFSGIFPSTENELVEKGIVNLVFCNSCSQVQLGNIFDPELMYGDNYGYMSHLNDSMASHLKKTSNYLLDRVLLSKNQCLVDIGSNDGTFLNFFVERDINLIGIDPTISKFGKSYHPEIKTFPKLFNKDIFMDIDESSADVVSSIAMFYDLDNPIDFIGNIYSLLKDNGYWYLELTYGTWMNKSLSFDTICHEHAVYYTFTQLNRLFNENGFSVEEVNTTKSNGGSIVILLQKKQVKSKMSDFGKYLIDLELSDNINGIDSWNDFNTKVEKRIYHLKEFLLKDPKSIPMVGLGASTKGNMLLQLLNMDKKSLRAIGEINPDKFGRFTPGTKIPIVDERDLFSEPTKQALVLPWHFRENIIPKQRLFLENGGQLIFPLPDLEIYTR